MRAVFVLWALLAFVLNITVTAGPAPVITLNPSTTTYSLTNGVNSAGIAISESNGNTSFSAASSNASDVYDTISNGVLTMHPQAVASGLTVTISDTSGNSVLAAPVVLHVSVVAAVSSAPTFAVAHAETCVDAYTAANGNPQCNALFDANDNPINGGPVPDPSSSPWLNSEGPGSANPTLGGTTWFTATQPGGANYGKDADRVVFYNLNGSASASNSGAVMS